MASMKAWSDVETRKRNEQQYRTVSSDLRGGFWCGLHSHVKNCTFVDGTSSQICCTYNLPSQSSSRLSRLSFSHPCLASHLKLSHTSHTARILDSNSHNLCAAVDTIPTPTLWFLAIHPTWCLQQQHILPPNPHVGWKCVHLFRLITLRDSISVL